MLLESYIFYADVYFVQNFIIKIAVLFLIAVVCRKRKVLLRKILLLAFAGTVSEIVVLMSGIPYVFFVLWLYLIEVPVISILVAGKEKTLWFRACVSGYVFTILINGMLEALLNVFRRDVHYVSLLMIASVISVVGAVRFLRQRRIELCIYPVELRGEGESIKVSAFYDSGNRLKDPYTGKGVHIASEKLLNKIDIEKEKMVYIPYQSLGNPNGLLQVCYVDEVQIHKIDTTIKLQRVPIGFTKESLFQGKNYEMILNEDVW